MVKSGTVTRRDSDFYFRPAQPRFLFVDDDSLVPRSLRGMLRSVRPGWRLDAATTAHEAAQRVQSERFDVVVGDVRTLERDAPEFLRFVQLSSPETGRVVHSVVRDLAAHLDAARGAQYLLTKPLDPGEFLNALDLALAASAAARRATTRTG
jgi:CheY-like chemotaxis protein